MAHNLATTSDGRMAMMYFGQSPWHHLGQRLDNPATAEEAITAAGLDYEVQLTPLATVDGLSIPQRKAVVRYDSQEVIGVVGNDYVPIQNRQAFGFLDAVVAAAGLRYHTAGGFGKGERIWMHAKLPEQMRVKSTDDLVDKFLLLSNAHDGTAALRVFFTPVRVVCSNTLAMAHRQCAGQGISIRHEGNLAGKIKQAQELLGLAHRCYDDAAAMINRMASVYPTQAQLTTFFKQLYPDPENGKNNARVEKIRLELNRLFDQGMGHDMPGIKGTVWAALNAVTEFVDHHRPSRGKDEAQRASNRLSSIWWGSGAQLKSKAWNLALGMAGAN